MLNLSTAKENFKAKNINKLTNIMKLKGLMMAALADGKVKILNLSVKKWWQYSTSYGSFGSYATAQDGAELPSLVAAE